LIFDVPTAIFMEIPSGSLCGGCHQHEETKSCYTQKDLDYISRQFHVLNSEISPKSQAK
jgi:hypothetical protein